MSTKPTINPHKRQYEEVQDGAEDAEDSLLYPNFFVRNHRGHWRCLICGKGQLYQHLSKAKRHEDTTEHVNNIREVDRPTEFSSPIQHPRDDIQDKSPSLSNSQLGLGASEVGFLGGHEHLPSSSPATTSESLHPIVEFGEGTTTSRGQRQPLPSIHGPALLGDNPEQLYDNWDGELAGGATEDSETWAGRDPDFGEWVEEEDEEVDTLAPLDSGCMAGATCIGLPTEELQGETPESPLGESIGMHDPDSLVDDDEAVDEQRGE
ncbi:hypothetical protein C8Q74DRAFT_533196 [Fomes fomentarius]|nr:hypothetical protein C8Q74DRAFT_533196 [Fomes fomentarius]